MRKSVENLATSKITGGRRSPLRIRRKYEELIMKKIASKGFGLLQEIITDLDQVDSIRCFFAALFLARDQKVDLEQQNDDIKIILMSEQPEEK